MSEFLSYDEMTDDQRRAIVQDVLHYLNMHPSGLTRHADAPSWDFRILVPVKPTVKRYVVEARPPKFGEQYLLHDGSPAAKEADHDFFSSRPVIVDEV